MSAVPSKIDVGSQSKRVMRVSDIRNINLLDHEFVISEDYSVESGVVIPGTPTIWTGGINVKGYDRIMVFVDLTYEASTLMTKFKLQVQSGFSQRSTVDADWYDRYTSFDILYGGATALTASNVIEFTPTSTAANTDRFFFDIDCVGHYMRFAPFGAGTMTNCHVYIRGIRDLS